MVLWFNYRVQGSKGLDGSPRFVPRTVIWLLGGLAFWCWGDQDLGFRVFKKAWGLRFGDWGFRV